MRLLSIFALLFLISFLWHGGLKDRSAPDKQAGPEEVEEVMDAEEAEVVQAEQEDFSALIFSQPYPVRHFDFEQEAVFSLIETEIKNLIIGRNDDSFKVKNHLCAVGYEFPRTQRGRTRIPGKKEVVVYWKEGKTLHRWGGGDPKAAEQDFYNARSLVYSRSIPLDPNQGVIGEKEETDRDKLGDYKERAEKVITDCEAHGKSYEIEPFAPPPRGFKRPEGGGRPRPAPARPAPESPVPPAPVAPSPSSPVV
ncbi:MAG: hypothetical protein LBE22_12135 [Azoarcus sp.]|nr:hypothetical protein [Azoarcus sp.]